MLCIPQVNHQKLVKECYPAPKALARAAPEYRPNANELGRLCYYAKYKPAKITKVGRLLAARATADKAALRAGVNVRSKASLMITLGITKELVGASPHGLTYAAPAVRSVVCNAVQAAAPGGAHAAWDADLCARATSTFAAYARALQPGAMEVDESVPVCVYAVLAELQPLVRGTVDESTRASGLGAFEGVVRSAVFYSPSFASLVDGVLPGVLDTLSPAHLPLARTAALLHEDGSVDVSRATDAGGAETSVAAALVLLRHMAHGADAVQIRVLVHATFAWLDASPMQYAWGDEDFCVWLLNLLALWTPRASRYVVPHTLADALRSTEAVNANTERSTRLLQALHQILANKIEIIGLNMTELLDAHLYFLLAHVQHDPYSVTIAPTIAAIGSLAQHTLYADQLPDFVQQTNTVLRAVAARTPPLPPTERDNSLRVLLYVQIAIIRAAYADGVRVNMPVTAWNGTEGMLLSPNAAVRFTYLEALRVHLELAARAQHHVQRGEAAYASGTEVLRFLHAFTANAYIVLARATYAPGASLDELNAGAAGVDVAQLATVPADYAALLAVLERLYEVTPAPALLTTVPALLALDRVATRSADVAARPAARAARWVVANALSKLATLWNVSHLVTYIHRHLLQPLGALQLDTPAFPGQFGAAPKFAAFGAEAAAGEMGVPDVETIAEYIGASTALQTATDCDETTLRDWLLRNWSIAVAVQDAKIGAQPVAPGSTSPRRTNVVPTPARIPTHLQRDNSMSVSQLRMALSSRASTRASQYTSADEPGALGDARSTASRSRRSRSQSGHLGSPPSLAALLDRYKVGESAPVSPSAYGAATPPGAVAPATTQPVSYGNENAAASYAAAYVPAAYREPMAQRTYVSSDAAPSPRYTETSVATSSAPVSYDAPVTAHGVAPPLSHVREQLTGLAPVASA